jgi:hypothetical protein
MHLTILHGFRPLLNLRLELTTVLLVKMQESIAGLSETDSVTNRKLNVLGLIKRILLVKNINSNVSQDRSLTNLIVCKPEQQFGKVYGTDVATTHGSLKVSCKRESHMLVLIN